MDKPTYNKAKRIIPKKRVQHKHKRRPIRKILRIFSRPPMENEMIVPKKPAEPVRKILIQTAPGLARDSHAHESMIQTVQNVEMRNQRVGLGREREAMERSIAEAKRLEAQLEKERKLLAELEEENIRLTAKIEKLRNEMGELLPHEKERLNLLEADLQDKNRLHGLVMEAIRKPTTFLIQWNISIQQLLN